MSIDYGARIPNNVDLASNRTLQRALEHWQPEFLAWWAEMGPEGFAATSTSTCAPRSSVDAKGWANFGYVKMPDYRWGIFLAAPEPDRKIDFGDAQGRAGLAGGARRVPLERCAA